MIIVEDEPLIRMVAVDIFQDAGFDVLEADHAADALLVLALHAAVVKILLTDVHMPGDMDGIGLAYHAHTHWPWINLLVASGKARPTAGELPTGCRFMEKPYTERQILHHVDAFAVA